MSKEDEFIHLILHSILDKNRFKERYKDRIRELFKKIDKGVVLSELKFKFGNIGVNLFYFIDSEKYDEALKLRNRLFLKIFSPIWLPSYFVIKGIRLREKFFKFIEGLSWILYRHLIKGHIRNREEIELDFNKIGINKKFVFRTLEEDTGLSKDLDIFGFREPMNWKNYCDFVEKDDVVLDIGANLGMFSLLSSNAKKIISVEPIKKCLPVLKKNISFNKLKEKSIVVNMAVGEKGELRLRKDERFNRSSVVDKDYEGPIYKIKSEPIEFFVKKYSVNLLRMDVEGYEYNILKNKIPKKINKISLEFHGGIMGKNKSEKLLKHLEKEGFVVTKIIEDLPLRLYPFYKILKKLGLMKKVTRVKENISMKETISFIFSGRNIKYLFLKR